ncbi:MAG: hypothetical protein ACPGVD_02255 [Flavobacteriales bacterium]
MKTIFKITCIIILLVNCNKDESSLNDYDLWGRLASKNGTWEIESLTTKDNSKANSTETDIDPNYDFISFFIRTEPISRVTVDIHTAIFYDGDNKLRRDCEAEEFRVVLKNDAIDPGNVWTVKENKSNTQVWTSTTGTITTTMSLKRCRCKIPKVKGNESGG